MSKDLVWALRALSKRPFFTASSALILALGIGANAAIFSIVDAVLLRPLPYSNPGALIRIAEMAAKRVESTIPVGDYLRLSFRSDLFEKTSPFLKDSVVLTGPAEPDQVYCLRTSGALFQMLGVRARLGRTLVQTDDDPGAPKVAVISDRLWQRRFHSDPGVLGRSLTVSGEQFTIAGVMPPEFGFPYPNIELWMPLQITPAMTRWVEVAARMKPGITIAQVQDALEPVAHELEGEDPVEKAGLKLQVYPWRERADEDSELTLVLVFAAVGLVLLIGCADIGSLLLSRAVERQKEIAIRVSLGARFWRIARQLLAESLILVALGGGAGVILGHYVLQFVLRQLIALPLVLPHLQVAALDGRVLLFNFALCTILTILCGIAPIALSFRTDVQAVLRGGRTVAGPRGSTRLFSFLIASEAAFAVILLVGSGLMIRSLIHLQQADHGIRPDHVLTLRVPVGMRTQLGPAAKYGTKPRQIAYYSEILDRIQRIPGVQEAAVVNNLPLSGVNGTTIHRDFSGHVIGISTRTITPRYFAAMGIPLIAGRLFTDADQAGSPGVVIINERLARQFFPDRNPIGQTIPSESGGPGNKVVGVVKDTPQLVYGKPAESEVYIPMRQFIFAAFMSTIVVRTPGDPLALAAIIQKEVWAVDPSQPVVKVETMNDVIAESIWRPRFSAWIFSVLGGLAVLLTTAGVYAVIAYTSKLRAHEIGIRVALGAAPRHVVGDILQSAMIPLSAGLAIGLAAALLLSRLLSKLLYGVSTNDAVTYLAATGFLLLIGAIASARPAWKAVVGDPLEAIRAE